MTANSQSAQLGHPPPTPAIVRAVGITSSERYLQKLCDASFLKFWSYAGLYRDQGKYGAGDGKEVCDLVVVFGHHVLLFSDKDCAFPNTGNIELDWSRWRRRAIDKSAEQLRGSERWIREHPDRLFLDRACTVPFPLPLPKGDEAQFHRVAVARGATPRCAAHYRGSPSLPIWSCEAERAGAKKGKPLLPFSITPMGDRGDVIHVFDEYSLDIVLKTLDTIGDFVHYLEKKEAFVTSSAFVHAAGEEELLAYYVQNWNEDFDLDFTLPEVGGLGEFGMPAATYLADGGWKELVDSENWQAWLAFQKPSYLWDSIVDSFAKYAFQGTLIALPPENQGDLAFHERILRVLAAENRTRRRMLSVAFLQHLRRVANEPRSARLVAPHDDSEQPVYAFVSLAVEPGESHEDYRRRRHDILLQYCFSAKHHIPHGLDFVAIGVEPLYHEGHSHDIVLFDARNWTDDDAASARDLVENGGFLTALDRSRPVSSEQDFVHARLEVKRAEDARSKPTGRNEPCPCGSGKKFKRCHGGTD